MIFNKFAKLKSIIIKKKLKFIHTTMWAISIYVNFFWDF